MDGDGIREAVEAARSTELDRLGSGKLMIALTGAEMDEATVLAGVAVATRSAAEALDAWAAADPDESAREAFAHAASRAADQHDRVAGELPADADLDVAPLDLGFDEADGTVERAGAGLVGWPLVADRLLGQAIGFFINEADTRLTDVLREVRADTRETGDRGEELLGLICEAEAERERAREAASAVVRAAYEDYAARLDAMGLDPRPIC